MAQNSSKKTRGANKQRPWALKLRTRGLLACIALRTNLTIREVAALFGISRSQAHRIIADMTRRLATLLSRTVDHDRRWSWVVDGTLVPTRDHSAAAKSKNYRWSCNAQVLARRSDLRILEVTGGGPGNRNDPVHYRGSRVEARCREHGRVLADGGYRGVPELRTPRFHKNRIVRDQAWRRHRKRRARIEHAIARLKNCAFCATIAEEAVSSSTRFARSPSFTTRGWRSYGTALSGGLSRRCRRSRRRFPRTRRRSGGR